MRDGGVPPYYLNFLYLKFDFLEIPIHFLFYLNINVVFSVQFNLFKESPQTIFFSPAGEVFFHPKFLPEEKANAFKKQLLNEIKFEIGSIEIQGRKIKQPRLIAWCGDRGYSYSGYTPKAQPFKGVMRNLLEIACKISGSALNGCLINWYRNELDSVGWHSDNEKGLIENGSIVSLSFGETRVFKIRPKKKSKKHGRKQCQKFLLKNGSLLIMRGDIQKHWEHCVPKTTEKKKDRINLTFRQLAK